MTVRPLCRFLLVCLLAAALAPASAGAQQQRTLAPDEEITPRQVQTVPASRPSNNTRSIDPADNPSSTAAIDPAAAPARSPPPRPASPSVSCAGIFAKDSTHLKLAQMVGATNIEFTAVAGAEGSTLNASVLYPKDPKRRLEVLWQNEVARSDISLIVITGQSQVRAPKGLRLGLALAALEKLNGKPFKLSGFDQPDGSRALDWQGGALGSVPGGCQIGIKLKPDGKAAPDALKAAAGKELLSSDVAVRAVKPVVGEIVIGY
jgi:hypothetical protein